MTNVIDPGNTRKTAKKNAIEQEARFDAGLPLLHIFEFATREGLASTMAMERVFNSFCPDEFDHYSTQGLVAQIA